MATTADSLHDTNLPEPQFHENFCNIKVVGVGGGGQNAVNRMIGEVHGVEFVVINTDQQALNLSNAPKRVKIGEDLTRGLGAGAQAELGKQAAEESLSEIYEVVKDADLIFITAGMGGGTGSGAAPLVAEAARDAGALAVGVVTMPFKHEGIKRRRTAETALQQLQEQVDALIVVENDRLTEISDKKASAIECFRIADQMLMQGVLGISDMITVPGEINLDFADIRTVIQHGGGAFMAIGMAQGENRAEESVQAVIQSTLLNTTIDGATAVVYNVKSKDSPQMKELEDIGDAIANAVAPSAEIFSGWAMDPDMDDHLQVTLLATGIPIPLEPATAVDSRERPVPSPRRTQPLNPTKAAAAKSAADGSPVERIQTVRTAQRTSSGLPRFLSN